MDEFFKEKEKEVWELAIKTFSVCIGVIVYEIQKRWGHNYIDLDPAVTAMASGFLLYSWTQAWATYNVRVRIDKHAKDITDAVDKSKIELKELVDKSGARNIIEMFDIRSYHDVEACHDLIIYKLGRARYVRNMCAITMRSRGDYDDYTIRFGEKIVASVHSVLKRNHRWVDILATKSLERERAIKAEGETQHYYARRLKYDMPMINFLLIEYEDNSREIIFGFGLHEEAREDFVYFSKNSHIFDTFEKYWASVWEFHTVELHERALS